MSARLASFDYYVEKTDSCWLWRGVIHQTGYGRYGQTKAHRFSWERNNKTVVPPGHEIHHKCKNKICVNPDHLECLPTKRHLYLTRGSTETTCPMGHAYDVSNMYINPDGYRQCRKCKQIYMTKYYYRDRRS